MPMSARGTILAKRNLPCCFKGHHIALSMAQCRHAHAHLLSWVARHRTLPPGRQDVDLTHGRIWIQRLKGSLSTEQPLHADELRTLKRYVKQRGNAQLPWLFLNERGDQFTRSAINYLVGITGVRAGLTFHVHPHMLRHGCGYALANRGYDLRLIQDYLGHRDPKHTTRYTRTAAHRFEGLWE